MHIYNALESNPWNQGVMFIQLNKHVREQIIKHILNKQTLNKQTTGDH